MKKTIRQKRNNRHYGFTLVEVLIVVIIIAVLAALILPRFFAQTERAKVAEASVNVGALCRAQDTYMQLTGSATVVNLDSNNAAVGWPLIGMTPPAGAFEYQCDAGNNNCAAFRVGSGRADFVNMVVNSGVFTCGGKYVLLDAARPDRGCTTNT